MLVGDGTHDDTGSEHMRQILVAVDEGAASERAAAFVNDFFAGLDVSILAVNVGSSPLVWGGYPAAPGLLYTWPYAAAVPAVTADERGELLDEARHDAADAAVQSSGLHPDETVVELGGDVAEALRRVAVERGVDLIVVGSSDKGFLERMVAPSVSKDLAKSAPAPVLVVH